jgi:hypothetical protein
MPAWQTLQFILLGRLRESPRKERGHSRNVESVDIGSDADYPRGSLDDGHGEYEKDNGADTLTEKWKKFKAKLRRTTSKKSLKSVRSIKSAKSGKSGVEKENDKAGP